MHIITELGAGGAETVLARLLEHWSDSGMEHMVISLGPDGPVGEKLRKLNIEVKVLNGKGRLAGPNLMQQARKITRDVRPEVILGWMYDGNLAAWWAARSTRSSLVWNIRHSLADFDRESTGVKAVFRLNSWVSRSPRFIIFNSRTAANQHVSRGFPAEAVQVIPNGFDTDRFAPSLSKRSRIRTELNISESSFLIGKIARYHPVKNHLGFLEAARIIAAKIPRAHFLLAGLNVDGKNQVLLRDVDKYGLRKCVHLLGEREDVPALNAALDVAVSASRGEGFSNAIGEAMACGVPVVATDVGDSRWIVDDTGRVVPPNKPRVLAQSILELYHSGENQRRALGARARSRIVNQYSIEKMVRDYKTLLLEAAEGEMQKQAYS